MNFDIDVVLPWVDGSDPEWIREKGLFLDGDQSGGSVDAAVSRYRNWDNLQYLLRGIDMYMPWVRKVHFITNGQLPDWLDTTYDKLNWVRHDEYIPDSHLPTFNSNAIELNVHRIKGVAEHFILFNDDMFITRPCLPSDFFSKKGLPRDQSVLFRVPSPRYDDVFGHTLLNNVGVINQNFKRRDVIRAHWRKLFSPMNSLAAPLFSSTYLPTNHFPGFMIIHTPQPFLRSVLEEIWEAEYDILYSTSGSRFRSMTDVTQYLVKEWQIVTGRFRPTNILRKSGYFSIFPDQLDLACRSIESGRFRAVCINDVEVGDFPSTRDRINASLDSILGMPSRFEKKDRRH